MEHTADVSTFQRANNSLAVVVAMACVRAFGAAAERTDQTARLAFEDVLIDVFVACPRK